MITYKGPLYALTFVARIIRARGILIFIIIVIILFRMRSIKYYKCV